MDYIKNLFQILAAIIVITGMGMKNPARGMMKGDKIPFIENKVLEPGQENIKIKIGLLLPASSDKDLLSRSALQGAELAIDIANAGGGYKGAEYEIVVRTAEGLWGAGSKASVDFVHEDNVLAIVTAVDGRNAHLAEQVASKSQVVQIATRATEETLSQAYVPWFFRIVPNDKQQADALIDEIYVEQEISQVHLLYERGYDYENGALTFKKRLKKRGFKLSGQSIYSTTEEEFNTTINERTEALIVFGSFVSAQSILNIIRDHNPSIQVFGSLNMTSDGMIGTKYTQGCEGGIFVSSKFCFTTSGQVFKDKYMAKYNQMPNPAASYAFDGINLIIEAVQKAGPDRLGISNALREIDYLDAATGPIRFDSKGNRISPVFMIRLIKGHPVILNP
jgi:branched-chain amino acid transport system substrate-binding protein